MERLIRCLRESFHYGREFLNDEAALDVALAAVPLAEEVAFPTLAMAAVVWQRAGRSSSWCRRSRGGRPRALARRTKSGDRD
ncbi:MAG: hypothetical protein F4Y26_17715 [Gammaproteobacteria bacterium]|nr:hypothetical protein [Gammaproteobacteria bacterium]